jgi:hypothetical protein
MVKHCKSVAFNVQSECHVGIGCVNQTPCGLIRFTTPVGLATLFNARWIGNAFQRPLFSVLSFLLFLPHTNNNTNINTILVYCWQTRSLRIDTLGLQFCCLGSSILRWCATHYCSAHCCSLPQSYQATFLHCFAIVSLPPTCNTTTRIRFRYTN